MPPHTLHFDKYLRFLKISYLHLGMTSKINDTFTFLGTDMKGRDVRK
jgi:hypothetical protein